MSVAPRPVQGDKAAQGFAATRQLAFRLGGQIDHLLLDEFQDTSAAQWRAIEPFARHVTHGSQELVSHSHNTRESSHQPAASAGSAFRHASQPKVNSFFCVGDMKQAIYGWRGGVAEIFDTVGRELEGLTEATLNTSFRSSPPVIDTVNKVFFGLGNHPDLDRITDAVTQWCARFKTHDSARPELAGYACLETAPEPMEHQDRREATLEFAAERTAQVAGQSPNRQVGVLVRKNDTVSRLIYLLRKRHIPASEEGGTPLTDSAAVNVVMSLLRLADHPGDTISRFHIAASPLSGLMDLTSDGDDVAAIRLSEQLRQQLIDDGYGPTVYRWAEALSPSCSPRELSRLRQLVEMAYEYQTRATLRSVDFVRLVETQRVADPTSANVRVMTIHQAKGLEFDIVVLPELDVPIMGQNDVFVVDRESPTAPVRRVCRYAGQEIQALMPRDLRRLFDETMIRDVNEALCVLYVALTRAVHALHMIIPPSKTNERKLPKTFSGLLRAALCDDQPVKATSRLFEHGQRDWCQLSKNVEDTAPERTEAPDTPVKLPAVRGYRRHGWTRTSPSLMEGDSRVSVEDLFDHRGQSARQRGTVIHAFFEQIDWLDSGRPTRDDLRRAAAAVIPTPDSNEIVEQWIDDFLEMLDRIEPTNILRRDHYPRDRELRVENERAIAYRDGDQLVTGSIDRLVLQYVRNTVVGADIIDFKTDRLDGSPNTLATKKTFYQPQIDAYRRAVSKLYGLDGEHIRARLIFVATGDVESL